VKHTNTTFYVALDMNHEGTNYPGIAEFDSTGHLLCQRLVNRPGWEVRAGSIDAGNGLIYFGLRRTSDTSQAQVMAVRVD